MWLWKRKQTLTFFGSTGKNARMVNEEKAVSYALEWSRWLVNRLQQPLNELKCNRANVPADRRKSADVRMKSSNSQSNNPHPTQNRKQMVKVLEWMGQTFTWNFLSELMNCKWKTKGKSGGMEKWKCPFLLSQSQMKMRHFQGCTQLDAWWFLNVIKCPVAFLFDCTITSAEKYRW